MSPGDVGFDINCGIRLLRTDLAETDVRQELAEQGIIVKARGWASLAEEAPMAYKDVTDVMRVS